MSVWTFPDDGARESAARALFRDLDRAASQIARRHRLAIALCGALIGWLAVLAIVVPAPAPRQQAAAAAAEAWIDSDSARPAFALDSAGLSRLDRTYRARIRSAGGRDEREELLTIGRIEDSGPYIRILIRQGVPQSADPGLFVETVRNASETGLALDRFGRPGNVESRWGALEAADVALSRGGPSPLSRAGCKSLRSGSQPVFQIAALICADEGAALDTRAAACLLDSVAAATGDEDGALRTFLQDHPRDPNCGKPHSAALSPMPPGPGQSGAPPRKSRRR